MIRKDIQGLRAIAVVAVLLFHFWPNRLTGGYVGVDVFFVISGFLITSHLLRKPPITKGMLVDFWARRIKRLIPAATVVLFITVIASLIWLPETMLQQTLYEAAAAAVYGENWMLAVQSTDYLASTEAPSPIQHYWSLSIEEQYYLLWPLVIGGVFLLGRRILTDKKLLTAVMVAVFLTSLLYSIYLTKTNAAAAYFVTPTRMWELTIGGIIALLALKVKLREWQSISFAWAGLAMIALAVVFFDSNTPFPGYTALLPTIGAALVILAAADNMKWSPGHLLGLKPVQFMGDISYAVYLWHWPVVVIAPFVLNAEYLVFWQKIIAIGIVTGLAYLTKVFIEDPVRNAKTFINTNKRTYAYGLASVVMVVGLSLGVANINEARAQAAKDKLAKALASSDSCTGAAYMRKSDCKQADIEPLMTTTVAKNDRSVLYRDGCWSHRPFKNQRVCTYGDDGSKTKVALIGNSHAGMWHGALEKIASSNGWRLDTYLVSECYTVARPLAFSTQALTDNCLNWNSWATEEVATGGYDTVIIANRTYTPLQGVPEGQQYPEQVAAYEKTINTFKKAGLKVLAIRDAPEGVSNIPDCLAEHGVGSEKCNGERKKVLKDDPLYDAALKNTSAKVKALDLSDSFCDETTCYALIGGIIVYFDHGHVTNTYTQTLAPDIEPLLVRLVDKTR